MKYILLVPDGMADLPVPELEGRTPLEVAKTPNIDRLASLGTVGMVRVTPAGMYPGSDAANMALLGYDPAKNYTGRGPVEAAAMGIDLGERDVAFRCSLVTTDGEKMLDYSSGHIPTEDARVLIELADQKLGNRTRRLFPGVSYRHILRWVDGPLDLNTYAPHENIGQPLNKILPAGEGERDLHTLIYDSLDLLDNHPINRRRRDEGKPAANTLWPWGQGRTPKLASFFSRWGITGAVVAAVDVVRGLGRLTGLEIISVPGATGYFDTNYEAKGQTALEALKRHDFVWIHVEAPDEAGHIGNIEEKIKAIERIDRFTLGTLLSGIKPLGDFALMIVPDHLTPVTTRGHLGNPVPYLLYRSDRERHQAAPYNESAIHEKAPMIEEGHRLIEELLAG